MRIVSFFAVFSCLSLSLLSAAEPLKVLIVDGRNNHDWVKTTDALQETLEGSGRFEVDVSTAPTYDFMSGPRRPNTKDEAALERYHLAVEAYKKRSRAFEASLAKAWDQWRPDFEQYDVVLLNYNGPTWPEEVQTGFEKYIREGGGAMLVHAANNGFTNWEAFNDMIGLGWRKKGFGVCVKVDGGSGKTLKSDGCGNSGHGSKHAFQVTVRAPEHPIMNGIPPVWMHAKDELYHHMRGPAKNLIVLSSAYSDPKTRGTGEHEPLTYAVEYGKGNVVVTTMGHVWRGQETIDCLKCVGFQTILARSCEWLGSGTVTIPVPKNFPGPDEAVLESPVPPVAAGEGGDDPQAAMTWQEVKKLNPYAYLTAEQARAAMVVQPGFEVELVAAAPQVEEPVLIVWDGNANMYAAEMRSYMQDVEGTGTKTLNNGRVRRLSDTDGDGVYDRSTIFIDGLNLPRMILPLDDWIAVVETDTVDVWAYRDTDGDGVHDEKKQLYQGERKIDASRSVEHQDAGLVWNTDNWIYNTRGRLRYRFTNGTWEEDPVEFDWNQWGLDHDDVGNLFFSDNSTPFEGFRQMPHYWNQPKSRTAGRRWTRPSLGAFYKPEFMTMHNLCGYGDKGPGPAMSFTSACGQSIFRGDALPFDMIGTAFVCDPVGHVVRHAKVANHNGRKMMENVTPGEEFIASHDIYFRPIFTATGPDGCLYINDISRGIIQDAPWVNPASGQYMKETGMEAQIQNGRIWRVRHEDMPVGQTPRMLDETTEQLLRHLQHKNGWWRDTAQKLIILRDDRDTVVPALRAMAQFDGDKMARMHALWTLEGIGVIEKPLVLNAIGDKDWQVRIAALRIAERWVKENDDETLARLADMHQDRDREVKRQAILSLGESVDERAVAAIEKIVENNVEDEGVFLAAMTSLYPRETPLIKRMMSGEVFRNIADAGRRANTQRRWQTGIKSWTQDIAPAREVSPEEANLIAKGAEIYQGLCMSCHNMDGKGKQIPGAPLMLGPSLVNSPRVLGQKEVLNRILLHGMTGPIDGTNYLGGVMAPMGANGDEYIAAVLTYIRQEWGHTASAIWPEEVAATRKAVADRVGETVPLWTLEALEAFSLPELTNQNDWAVDCSAGEESARRPILGKGSCDNSNQPGRWYQIDLGAEHKLTSLLLDSVNPDRYPRGWELLISDDGKDWSDPVAKGKGARKTNITFEPLNTRFLRVVQTGESKHHRWSISKLKVFGVAE